MSRNTMAKGRGPWLAVSALALAAAGCGDDDGLDRRPDAGVELRLSDGEIAEVVRQANRGEIRQGELARDRATATDVRQYAEQMIAEHRTADDQLERLLDRANIDRDRSAVSEQLERESDQIRSQLQDRGGADFDRAYMDAQIAFHQRVVDLIDQRLTPEAANAELRGFLATFRATIAGHLQRARDVRAGLPVAP